MNYTCQHNMKYLTHALQFLFNFPNREMSLSTGKFEYTAVNPLMSAVAFPCLVSGSMGQERQKTSGCQHCSVCFSVNCRRNLAEADALCKYEFRLGALKICPQISKGWRKICEEKGV